MRRGLGSAAALGALLAAAGGCRWQEAPRGGLTPDALLADSAVVAVDGAAPRNGFDGWGSLIPGEGWGKPQGDGSAGDWGSMAWVVGDHAELYVPLPPVRAMDFYARCLPYPWQPGSPEQDLDVRVNGRSIGHLALRGEWQDVRLPLPPTPSGRGPLRIELRFAHAIKPRSRGEPDDRSLAAAFSLVAAVPHGVPDAGAFVAAQRFDPQARTVSLPMGGALRLPVPAASAIHLRLADLRVGCAGCALRIWLGRADRSRRVAVPFVIHGDELTADLTTAEGQPATLWVEVIGATGADPAATVGFALAELAAEPQNRARAARPNVFLYVIDTLRADELARAMPQAQRFAADAVTYTNARSASSWTLPSVVSLLTGLYTDRHGVLAGDRQFDGARTPGLQHLLGRAGYATLAISQSAIVSPEFGLDQGFQHFHLDDQLNGLELRSQDPRSLLASWLPGSRLQAPLFVYVQVVDPHAPYSPPGAVDAAGKRLAGLVAAPPANVRETPAMAAPLRRLYESEVRYTDVQLGRFLDLLRWLRLYDDALIVVAADHGEEFGEHGGLEHGTTLYDEVLRVPLLIKYPGKRSAGARVSTAVSLVDVAPTVLAVAGVAAPAGLDGLPLDAAATRPPGRVLHSAVASKRARWYQLDSAIDGGLKCIRDETRSDDAGGVEAFDLRGDPGEVRTLGPTAVEACRRLLAGWRASRARLTDTRSQRAVDGESLARLRALGYGG